MKLHISKTKSDVAQDFAKFLMDLASDKESITVALSGGSTPKIVFDYLAANYKETDWSKFHFYWGDERCVLPTDEQSNYKMTVDHLFSKIKLPEANIHRILGENIPEAEAVRYSKELEQTLASENEVPQFDLVILGMGDDGHIASIFSHQSHLLESAQVCEVAIHPETAQKRITLTGPVLNRAKQVAFLITGENKADVLAQVINKTGEFASFPASHIEPDKLTFYVDEAAAKSL